MRPEKSSIVSDLSEKLNRSPFVLVTDYQRMNVNHFADLRNRLAARGAEVHVVKNSFLRRAMSDSGLPDVASTLTGQTAIVTGEKDVAPVAKVLKMFAAEFKIAALKIGVIEKSILSTQELETLAELPAREVLLAQLLGLLLAPATKLVRVLNEPASALARLLNAKASKMPAPEPEPTKSEPSSAAPAKDEAPKTEAPVAETPKTETPAAETPKTEAAVVEAPKTETAAVDAPTAETEAAKPEAPATEVAGQEAAPKPEAAAESGPASEGEPQKEGGAADSAPT